MTLKANGMKRNLHTHSTFCDGKNTPEEMVRAAIAKGFDAIGFSSHFSLPEDDKNFKKLREFRSAYIAKKEAEKQAKEAEKAAEAKKKVFERAASNATALLI